MRDVVVQWTNTSGKGVEVRQKSRRPGSKADHQVRPLAPVLRHLGGSVDPAPPVACGAYLFGGCYQRYRNQQASRRIFSLIRGMK